jgi:membrane protein
MVHPEQAMNPTSAPATATGPEDTGPRPVRRVISRTLSKAWDDDIFSHSAQAAFWQALSLPPLFLALLGSLGFVSAWFGPETLQLIDDDIIDFARRVFTADVVEQIIAPTADSILTRGRADVVSIGFIVSLWAGSSAVASIVDSITHAHDQKLVRNPVWQRIFSLLLYLFALVVAVFTLPILVLGPDLLPTVLPESWRPVAETVIQAAYYPATVLLLVAVLTTFYKLALPHSLPWRRLLPGALLAMVVFVASTTGLRVYIALLTSSGYTYGALATPIAFLLFAFLLGLAIVLGSHLNNAVEEVWPSRPNSGQRRSVRLREAAKRGTDRMTGRVDDDVPADVPADLPADGQGRSTVRDHGLPAAGPAAHAAGTGPTAAKESR